METTDHVFLWKRLYWAAIEAGYEPQKAEAFANHLLSSELKPAVEPAASSTASGRKAAD